jgi:hypothetical protein
MKLESFEKEVEFPFIPNVYYIHDNGGRPFRVSIDRDSKTASIDESNDEDIFEENFKGVEWKNILNIKYTNVYVGENDEEDEDLVSGNSILFQLSKHKYLIVMSVIAEINIDDEIKVSANTIDSIESIKKIQSIDLVSLSLISHNYDKLYISTHTFSTVFYILRKSTLSKEKIYNDLSDFELLDIDKTDCHLAYNAAKNIDDIEDCLELFSAKRNKLKTITADQKMALNYGNQFKIILV